MDVRSIGVSLTIRMAVMLASSVIGHMQYASYQYLSYTLDSLLPRAKLESKLESRVQIHFRYLRLNGEKVSFRGGMAMNGYNSTNGSTSRQYTGR